MHGHSFIEQISATPDGQSALISGMVQVISQGRRSQNSRVLPDLTHSEVVYNSQQELSKQNPKERLMLRTHLNLQCQTEAQIF